MVGRRACRSKGFDCGYLERDRATVSGLPDAMNTTGTILICLKWAASGAAAITLVAWVYPLASIPLASEPSFGHRGLKRKQTRARTSTFRLIEPVMRLVASWVSRLPLFTLRRRLDFLLTQAGDPLGVTADETIALGLLGALALFCGGIYCCRILSFSWTLPIAGFCLGAYLPILQLKSSIRRRFKEVSRCLPAEIDLAALCMSAGCDFPGALKLIVDHAPSRMSAVEEEFSRILQELEVGHTRKQALEAFAERLPTEAVRNFVGAVIQAEERGNPLAEVLQIQARVLRMHRSVAAEEAAARAGVLMMIPLFLLLCSILLVLFGPFIVNGIGL
ncbi:MAG: type II secretion system F family protein [Deltaproteobacteria bacterium]|nr:type II secretion system F family protein [Deltaproteobacteria bacterium]